MFVQPSFDVTTVEVRSTDTGVDEVPRTDSPRADH